MILKPFSNLLKMDYRNFINQNYFIALNNHGLKKINLKGINKISKESDKNFTEIEEKDIFIRKFEDCNVSKELMSDNDKPAIVNIITDRLEKVDKEGNVDVTFVNLGASFSMEMIDILWIYEMSSQEVQSGLEVIKDSLNFSDKGDIFEMSMNSAQKYLKYLENPSDHNLFIEIKNTFEKCIEEYNGNPFAHFMLGLIYHRPTSFFDLNKSQAEFLEAKKFAVEIENNYIVAICNFMLAWIYYINYDIDKAIELSIEAIDNEFLKIPELYYNLSKYYAVKNDPVNAIKYLDETIKMFDHLYAVKADIDDDFNLIKSELLKYFIKLRDEKKTSVISRLNEMGISFAEEKNNEPQNSDQILNKNAEEK